MNKEKKSVYLFCFNNSNEKFPDDSITLVC